MGKTLVILILECSISNQAIQSKGRTGLPYYLEQALILTIFMHPPHGPGVCLDELVVSDYMRGHGVIDPPAVRRDEAVGH